MRALIALSSQTRKALLDIADRVRRIVEATLVLILAMGHCR